MKKRTIIFSMLFIIAIILVLLTILVYNLNKKTSIGMETNTEIQKTTHNIENVNSTNILQTNSASITISPNASITFFKHYIECGHTLRSTETVESSLVNLDQDEFKSLYSDWKINKFTGTEIELYKDFNGSCGEHYLVKSNNGYVCIYNIKNDKSLELKETTTISIKYLSDSDILELERGVTLYGRESLNSYIENFE